jgi:hypothetical protein
MKAQTLILDGVHAKTKTLEFSSPSTEDLTETSIFLSKEGVAYDESTAALQYSFLSMPRQHLEAELKTTVQDIFESRRRASVSLREHIYIPGLVPGYWNYYHLLIDSLPRILFSLNAFCPAARILVTQFQAARLKRGRGDLLTQMGNIFELDKYLDIAKGDLLHVERAIIPKQRVRFIGSVMQIFQDVAARSGAARSQRRVYISRRLATARRVINEESVISVLQEFGFQPVCLEQMAFEEQINVFRGSDVIIGPHGAGLANIVFSKSGTTLIELLQDSGLYKVPVFAELTAIAGGKHVVLVAQSEANPKHPGHPGNMDMTVDCVRLRTGIESLLT